MDETKETKKIFIVDDDNFLLDMYLTKFKNAGYDVSVASGSDDCLEKMKAGLEPDVFIFDLIMPKMNGIELFKKLKNLNLIKPEMINIILSNQGKAEDLDRVKDLGVDGYIVKALHTPSEVVEKVEGFLNKKK